VHKIQKKTAPEDIESDSYEDQIGIKLDERNKRKKVISKKKPEQNKNYQKIMSHSLKKGTVRENMGYTHFLQQEGVLFFLFFNLFFLYCVIQNIFIFVIILKK
jgi:hypothetical protein